jgi:hypothetical protein
MAELLVSRKVIMNAERQKVKARLTRRLALIAKWRLYILAKLVLAVYTGMELYWRGGRVA